MLSSKSSSLTSPTSTSKRKKKNASALKHKEYTVNNIPSHDVTYCGWLRLPIRVRVNSSIWSTRSQGKSLINLVIADHSLTKIASSKRSLMTSIRYRQKENDMC